MALQVISGTTRTNLGPFTTPGTFSYTCTEVIQQCPTCDFGWAAQTCVSGVVTDNTDCWPPRATGVPATSGALLGWGVYSPGIICPRGYTSVVTAVSGGSSDFRFQFPLTAGESAIGCCPEGGFAPIEDGTHGIPTCVQFQPTTSFLLGSCGSHGPAFTPFTIGATYDSKLYLSFSASAPFMQMVYQASDLPTTSTSTLTESTATTTSSDLPVSPTNGQIQGTSTSSGLSAGAAAGIAIGALLGVILAATAAFCLWRRHRKRRVAASSPESKPYELVGGAHPKGTIGMENPQQPGYSGVHSTPHSELATPVPELESHYAYR